MVGYFPKIPKVFDCTWYHNKYPDVKADIYYGENTERAWEHFVNHGLGEGRQYAPNGSVLDPVPLPNSSYFDFFGRQQFLVLISYFNWIGAMDGGTFLSDLDYLESKGIKGVRIYLNFAYPQDDEFEFLFLPSGGCNRRRVDQLQTLLFACAEREMIIDISASRRDVKGQGFQMPMEKYRTAWKNLSIHLKNMGSKNIIIDLDNEHLPNYWDGQKVMSEAQAASIRNAVRVHLPNVEITASVCNVSPGKAAAIARTEGMSFIGFHDPRVVGWARNTKALANQCKAVVGENIKICFQEPIRVGWKNIIKSAGDLLLGMNGAKSAQIAAWYLHNQGCYRLKTTLKSRLHPINREFLNRLKGAL